MSWIDQFRTGPMTGEAVNAATATAARTVLTGDGPLRVDMPRNRGGSFEPVLVPKHERRFSGFDDKIIAMYARGQTQARDPGLPARELRHGSLARVHQLGHDAVMAEVTEWQSRLLEAMYPVVLFDALRVKIREDAAVRNKAIYLDLGVLPDGTRDILEVSIEGAEAALDAFE